MDAKEIGLLITQLSGFHDEVRRVSDALAEAKLDLLSKLHKIDTDLREGLHSLETKFSQDLKACEVRLVGLSKLESELHDMQRDSKVLRDRQDAIYGLLMKHGQGFVINNHSTAEGGSFTVDTIDTISGDIVQGEKKNEQQ